MHTKNLLVLFALTTSIFSAPIPSPRFSSLGSAFGNLNWNGAGNSVGNGNKGNGNDVCISCNFRDLRLIICRMVMDQDQIMGMEMFLETEMLLGAETPVSTF